MSFKFDFFFYISQNNKSTHFLFYNLHFSVYLGSLCDSPAAYLVDIGRLHKMRNCINTNLKSRIVVMYMKAENFIGPAFSAYVISQQPIMYTWLL